MMLFRSAFTYALMGAIMGLWIPLAAQENEAPPLPHAPPDPQKEDGTPPAADDPYGPPLPAMPANPNPPMEDATAPVNPNDVPADSSTSNHEANAGNVIPAPPVAVPAQPPAPDLMRFERDVMQQPLYQTAETQREQAEALTEEGDIPDPLPPPETLPALSILPAFHLGPATLAVGFRYAALYDTNILLSAAPRQEDFEHILSPRFSLGLGDVGYGITDEKIDSGQIITEKPSYLRLNYDPQYLFFQRYSQYNAFQQDLVLNAQYVLQQVVLHETFDYNHSTDPDRETQGRLTRDIISNVSDAIFHATDRTSFELEGTILSRNFEDEIDSNEARLRFWTRYRATPTWTASVGTAGGVLIPDEGTAQVFEQAWLATQNQIGTDLNVYLGVAGDFREKDTSGAVRITPLVDAVIRYEPSTETRVELSAVREIFNSPSIPDQNFVSTRVKIHASQRLMQTYMISLDLGYENADYFQFGKVKSPSREDNYPTAKVEFSYARFLDINAGIFYLIRKNFSSEGRFHFFRPTDRDRISDRKPKLMIHMMPMKRTNLMTVHFLTSCLCLVLLGTLAYGQKPVSGTSNAKGRILAPGDTVNVTVYQDPALNTIQPVATDGTIEMFYIGPVHVMGITSQAAAAKIAEMLYADKYIRNAQVRVSVDQYVTEVVTVKGEVNRPGPVTLPTERPMDLLEAIASAGGETRAGDLSHVQVRRTKDGQTSTQKVNLKELTKQNQVLIVEPGDVITVGIRMF